MSRVVRHEVGLNIVCRDHPTEVLFYPRMSLDEARKLREAGPQTVQRGITGEHERRTYSRDCPRAGCRVHAEFVHDKVRMVLMAMAQYQQRGVWTVTDYEMTHMVRRPPRAPGYLAARRPPEA